MCARCQSLDVLVSETLSGSRSSATYEGVRIEQMRAPSDSIDKRVTWREALPVHHGFEMLACGCAEILAELGVEVDEPDCHSPFKSLQIGGEQLTAVLHHTMS